ncbi:MAG: ABC transporter ATP-binding protein [Planctomycetia bacterium]|jgi:energy-coupling factor transporter ATP-binding protein EcfA2
MIRLQGVSYQYTNTMTPALQDVDLTVSEGEWLLLVGPSGGGKSTLLYLLNGLIPHILDGDVSGEIQVDGIVPKESSVRELSRQVGTVFQNPETQLFMLRVDEDVAFGCENLCFPPPETQRRVEHALDQLSLRDLRHQEVFSLSGGQKQRLAIAGALAMGCRTLLLDEPTSNLDEESRKSLLTALTELHQAGHTILMTEHRLDGLENLVDRVVTVDDGTVSANDDFPTQTLPARKTRPESEADDTPLVDMQEVTFAYEGRASVLENLSLRLAAGEIVALLGPNGCGKTTLLKLLCGLLRPRQGELEIVGKKRPKIADLIGQIGFLFQDPDEQLFADTVYDEIDFGPKNLGRTIDVEYYLKRLGLEHYRDSHPRSLSRGQRQRLAAATVLALRPKLILLDEPTTGLDQDAWIALMEFILEEAAPCGAGVVFSTHHAEVVELFADRVVTLTEGRIVDDRLH